MYRVRAFIIGTYSCLKVLDKVLLDMYSSRRLHHSNMRTDIYVVGIIAGKCQMRHKKVQEKAKKKQKTKQNKTKKRKSESIFQSIPMYEYRDARVDAAPAEKVTYANTNQGKRVETRSALDSALQTPAAQLKHAVNYVAVYSLLRRTAYQISTNLQRTGLVLHSRARSPPLYRERLWDFLL